MESFQNEKLIRRIQYADYQKVQNIWTPLSVEVDRCGTQEQDDSETEKLQVQRAA